MATLKEALRAAFASSGSQEKTSEFGGAANHHQEVQGGFVAGNAVLTVSDAEFLRLTKLGLRRVAPSDSAGNVKPSGKPVATVPSKPQPILSKQQLAPKLEPDFQLVIAPNARFALRTKDDRKNSLLPGVSIRGVARQCFVGKAQQQREVALGLDFGTSCVKAVLGDAALDKAYAVPFLHGDDISAYLLPTRVFETDGQFSLEHGTNEYRDLKLSFVADPEDMEFQIRIVAFLSLVIARTRGWFFVNHAALYQTTEIFWKISVGLPAASSLASTVTQPLEKLIYLAWYFSGDPESVTRLKITKALTTFSPVDIENADLEVAVVPEIAAQIYGFVVSNSFDKMAANNYLMVDVGAGTVDSSLFHVKPGKGGKWDFDFYTTVVEPLGVVNLHRNRVNWWSEQLNRANANQALTNDLIETKYQTDSRHPEPEDYQKYFDGIQVKRRDGVESPDKKFFENKVVTQVRGKTLWRAWKAELLPKQAIQNIPFFLCGGGARMQYFLNLETALLPQTGFSWLQAEAWTLGVPGDLIADGLADEDFDRISVAYGLSKLEVGRVLRAAPMPKVEVPPVDTWRDNYVDKDQC
jgi:hypothetical protein